MDEITITVERPPNEDERRKIIDGLVAHNLSRAGDSRYETFAVLLRGAEGEIMGGLLGEIYWDWLHVDILWVHDSLRGRGYGERLMSAAEREAVSKGCVHAFLDTFSFQARPFYEKLGYEVFGQLDDFPAGHARYFLRKTLRADDGAPPGA